MNLENDSLRHILGHEPFREPLLVVVHFVFFAVEIGSDRIGLGFERDVATLDVALPFEASRIVLFLCWFVGWEVLGFLSTGFVVELAEDASNVFDSAVPVGPGLLGEHPAGDVAEYRIFSF
nr:hypothetical protein [Natrinema pellirubrum]